MLATRGTRKSAVGRVMRMSSKSVDMSLARTKLVAPPSISARITLLRPAMWLSGM